MAAKDFAIRIGVVAGLLAAPGSLAASSDNASLAISGWVPTICQVSFGSTAPALRAGFNELGQMTELCNSIGGYRVVLDHPSGLVGAAVLVGGTRIAISPEASRTVIVDSATPASRVQPVQIILAEDAVIERSFGVRAEAKGATF